jgi:hypothetical protein
MLPEIIQEVKDNLLAMGPPEEILDEILSFMMGATNWDMLWSGLRDGYNKIAEREMNRQSGGIGGRPLPNMEEFLERLPEIADRFVPVFTENLQLAVAEEPDLFNQLPPEVQELTFSALPEALLISGPEVVTEELMKYPDLDKDFIHEVQMMINRVAFETLEPFLEEFAPPEDLEFAKLYMEMGLKLVSQAEFARVAVELGYDVHGGSESGHAKMPDLSVYMPEIADAFGGYLRDFLPRIPGMEEFFD